MKKGLGKGLGKGLDALLTYSEATEEAGTENVVFEVEITKVEPSRDQPRKHFEQDHIEELAESIKEYGVIQPLIVRPDGDKYIIVAGERRWRAANIAGLAQVPVIVKEYSDLEMLEVALIENVQREDLNPMEEATCYKRLNEGFDLSQEVIAKKVGKSRSHVTNMLRLLKLDSRVADLVVKGDLSAGHAKALISIENKEIQYYYARKIVNEGASVRAAEEFVRKYSTPPLSEEEQAAIMQGEVKERENHKIKYVTHQTDLRGILGTRVNIRDNRTGGGGGKIEINYFSEDDLNRIVEIVKKLKK